MSAALAVAGINPAGLVLIGELDEFADNKLLNMASLLPSPLASGGERVRRDSPRVVSLSAPAHLGLGWRGRGRNGTTCDPRNNPKLVRRCGAIVRRRSDVDPPRPRYGLAPVHSLREADAPLPVVAACDEFLTLADGRRVIDGISSWWTIQHGHRHPPLMAALAEAAARIDHVHFAASRTRGRSNSPSECSRRCPGAAGACSIPTTAAPRSRSRLKMAYQFWCHRGETRRTLFIGFEGGYHGDTFGAMSVGRDPLFFAASNRCCSGPRRCRCRGNGWTTP